MDEMEIRITNVIENTRNAPIVRDWVRKMLRARDEVKRLEGEILTLNTDCLRKNGRINELKAENWRLSDDAAQAIQYAVDVKAQLGSLRDRLTEVIEDEEAQSNGG